MSERNVELVRGVLASAAETLPMLERGEDITGHPALDLWRPDCVVTELAEVPDAQTYHGREGLIRYFERQFELWSEIEYRPQEFIECGDSVVVTCEIWARSRAGAEVAMTVHQVYELRDGAIASATAYLDRAKALGAAGLPTS